MEKDQQCCQSNFTSALLQRLTLFFYHSVSQWACRLFAAEAPCIHVTFVLGPRHVKVVSASCQIHLLQFTPANSIFLSLKPFKKRGENEEEGKRMIEAEGKKKENWRRFGRHQEVMWHQQEAKKLWNESFLAPCGLSAKLVLGKHLAVLIAMSNGCEGLRDTTVEAISVPLQLLDLTECVWTGFEQASSYCVSI